MKKGRKIILKGEIIFDVPGKWLVETTAKGDFSITNQSNASCDIKLTKARWG